MAPVKETKTAARRKSLPRLVRPIVAASLW
jgi:hypothetical protein